eukprot:5447697-Pyramimonas_sp.AAC.1
MLPRAQFAAWVSRARELAWSQLLGPHVTQCDPFVLRETSTVVHVGRICDDVIVVLQALIVLRVRRACGILAMPP